MKFLSFLRSARFSLILLSNENDFCCAFGSCSNNLCLKDIGLDPSSLIGIHLDLKFRLELKQAMPSIPYFRY